jgi:hypothetical protein
MRLTYGRAVVNPAIDLGQELTARVSQAVGTRPVR